MKKKKAQPKKKVNGKAMALARFTLWLKNAPKIDYVMSHSKTTFVIHSV